MSSLRRGVTFWALSEIVKAQAGILEGEPTDEAAGKLREAVERWSTTRMKPPGCRSGWPLWRDR